MRVQDRLAESKVENISREATDASGIPLQANDDDLVYATTYSEWRLLSPEERRNTYSIVYSCIYRPHKGTYYELSADGRSPLDESNIVPKARIDYVIDLLKKIAEELKSKKISYSHKDSHYCHDDENYPRDDLMAFRYLTFFLTCPKKDIAEVVRKFETCQKYRQED